MLSFFGEMEINAISQVKDSEEDSHEIMRRFGGLEIREGLNSKQ